MTTEERLEKAKSLLATWATEPTTPEPERIDIVITPDDLLPALKALKDGKWGYLAALTGLDHGPAGGKMEALYHLCDGAAVVTLRVQLGRETPSVPTICGLHPVAGFYERELGEMFGVTVIDTPDTSKLFLPDDWPDGVYPLRKDAVLNESDATQA